MKERNIGYLKRKYTRTKYVNYYKNELVNKIYILQQILDLNHHINSIITPKSLLLSQCSKTFLKISHVVSPNGN